MSLESEAMLLGIWKTYDELEESLTIEQLNMVINAAHEREYRNWKFQAALKGHNLDEQNDRFEEVRARAEAANAGMTEEEAFLADIGIDIEI